MTLRRTFDPAFLNQEKDERAIEFGRKFHALSPWRHERYDPEASRVFVHAMQENPDGYYLCTNDGFIGGVLTPMWFAPDTVLAVELFWYSEKTGEGQRLRNAFESWAKQRGAKYIQFSALADAHEPAVRRIMARSGYDAIEIGFRKTL